MRRSRTAPWYIGTAIVALVILGGAWLLGISPLLESAAEKRELAEFERSRIDLLESQLSVLREDFEHLDEFRAELEALQVEIPTGAELADLTRRLSTLADQAGLVIVTVNPSSAVLVVPPTPVEPPVEAPAEPAPEGEATEPAAEPPTEPTQQTGVTGSAPPATAALYAIPVEIVTLGGYEASLEFLERLQERDVRLILVSQIAATGKDEAGAEPPRPALVDGDLELRLNVYVFALVDPSVPVEESDVDTPQPPDELPVPVPGQRNPFQSLS